MKGEQGMRCAEITINLPGITLDSNITYAGRKELK